MRTEEKSYWKGRLDGWCACENMVIKRIRECGYDLDKLYPDILQ
jgi:hypothetical protein